MNLWKASECPCIPSDAILHSIQKAGDHPCYRHFTSFIARMFETILSLDFQRIKCHSCMESLSESKCDSHHCCNQDQEDRMKIRLPFIECKQQRKEYNCLQIEQIPQCMACLIGICMKQCSQVNRYYCRQDESYYCGTQSAEDAFDNLAVLELFQPSCNDAADDNAWCNQ